MVGIGSAAVKAPKSPQVNTNDDRPTVAAMTAGAASSASGGTVSHRTTPTNKTATVVTSPASSGSTTNTPRTIAATPRTSAAAEKARRIRSILMKIQCCLVVVFCILVGTTINIARLSGHIMEAVDIEVQDGKASVLQTLHKFKKMRKNAIKSLLKDDDDQYVKVKKEDYLKQVKGGNLKGSTGTADTNEKEEEAAEKKKLEAAKQMEQGGDEMDQFKAQQDVQKSKSALAQQGKAASVEKKKPPAVDLFDEFAAMDHPQQQRPQQKAAASAVKKKPAVPAVDLFDEFAAMDRPQQHQQPPPPKKKPAAPAVDLFDEFAAMDRPQQQQRPRRQQQAPAAAAAAAAVKAADAAKDPMNIMEILEAGKAQRKAAMDAVDPDYNPAGIPSREKRHYDNRWEMSDHMPNWMKDYFVWQDTTRATLTDQNWKTHRYLIMTCLDGQVCGNVAHRLRPIPPMIRVGYNTGRIFLIHWGDDDHRLETFLEPPHHGGLDWRVPAYMIDSLMKTAQWEDIDAIDTQAKTTEKIIVSTMVQDNDFAEPYYDHHIADREWKAEAVFHDVFNVLFKPTSMLYERVEETHHTMGIFRGKFASVHIDYEDEPKTTAEKQALAAKVQNAMNCVSNLRPGGPFLVAAQTFAIASEAVKYAKKHKAIVAARQVAHDTATLPHDIWNSFLEIYFMANSKCVAYGKAGYGQLGYIMGYDYNCKIDYNEKQCEWTNTQAEVNALRAKEAGAVGHANEQANAKDRDDDALHLHKDNVPKAHAPSQIVKGMPEWLGEWWKQNQAAHATDRWMTKTRTLPEWLKAYLSWHKATKPTMTEDGWKEQARYMVMTCYAEQHCGNVPNRMRPLPAHLRVAAETQRLLLIHWDKPNHLENFVVPPADSIQWQVPDYMMWKVRASAQQNDMDILYSQSKQWETRKVVNSMYNADDEGNDFYDARRLPDELEAERVLREIFYTMFEPTQDLQNRINDMLDMVKLKPGEYSVAHIDDPRVPGSPEEGRHLYEHVEKALNCLSQIAPGQPYLALSETFEGSQMASMFGRSKGIKVPAKQINHEAHLIPRDLMGSFAEVYVASMGKCFSYNNGGFGRMAYALQENFSCKIRYAGKNAKACQWNDGTVA